ncbi:hypothetical protein D8Y22_04065 [Salinadaptatus halalkaliphilus]|uniref:Uncharacterized protein n=1 Tax=Salinadaptatus halalkaliphilus TaxID=2419781 RepID=A0A4S3TPH0_9EURY|nr:DUF5787 family protein [Salinadaptatus halalkaliphilus]THE66106.1 hypothetical protein D8Y22_04065 [Salinadaptatus halalkaliphilus]
MSRETAEFGFELRTCRWAEREWPPDRTDSDDAVLVARQLGTGRRRWDTIVLECDREALGRRANFGPTRLDSDLLHVVANAPSEWRYYRDALPHPGYPWRYVREAIHQAADRGILRRRKRGNRIEIRRRWPYPDWVTRIVAIENKPDLDASAARALAGQLEYDVAMALADEVWVATKQTDEAVEPVLLEDLPIEAGVLTLDTDRLTGDVEWFPRTLAVEDPGTRILERPTGTDGRDASAARFEYADPEGKAQKRLEIAERAYERGWRSFVDTMRPDCRHFEGHARDGTHIRPYCRAHGRCQTAAECGGSCPEFEPEPPIWRTNGWPLEGGPGGSVRRLLERRRRRRRPDL